MHTNQSSCFRGANPNLRLLRLAFCLAVAVIHAYIFAIETQAALLLAKGIVHTKVGDDASVAANALVSIASLRSRYRISSRGINSRLHCHVVVNGKV